ncbi:hypothetical protein HW115_07890 [Verrucomicrobiaceae bacterium N1E253]|uniref:Zn-dependent protease n=1 Tax=Oceaniferula marina TaxID=2748318 RepID=A0A851GCQ8_9BACT|nr:hypothetical protein [Oceaniferula marina]NWK55528.1 hypothetical protein [Oceaniferula marina]
MFSLIARAVLFVLALLPPLMAQSHGAGSGKDQLVKGKSELPVVAVLPFAGFDSELTKLVVKQIKSDYAVVVKVLAVKPLPQAAYYPPRSRYRAEKLLAYLEGVAGFQYDKIIGLTHKDISTSKGEHQDWGILGLGRMGGSPCVVSTYRLRARGADEARFRERLVRVATHEIGHTFGLPHCPEPECNMRDAMGSILSVDQGDGRLCVKCKAAVSR